MKNINAMVKEYNRLYDTNMFSIGDMQNIINESDGDKYDIILNALKVGYTIGRNDGYKRATRDASVL